MQLSRGNYDERSRRNNSSMNKYGRMAAASIFRCGRDFCLETSVHGFNHIAAGRRHWAERVLWAAITAAAIWGAASVSLGQWQRYQESPTVITLEKDYRTWLFNLPSITTCDGNRVDRTKLPGAIATRWGVGPGDDQYPYYEKFVMTVANSDLFHLSAYEQFKDDIKLNVDLYALAVEVMPQLQVKATWSNGQAAKWYPVMTEEGPCYAINSVAIADVAIIKPTLNDTKSLPMTCKYSALSCFAIFEIVSNATFYIHSPYDVVDVTGAKSVAFASLNRVKELSVIITRCGKDVRDLQPQRRGCLYTDEPTVPGRKVYSTNTCRLSCRSSLALKLCGCKPFYYNYEEGPICTPAGMWCLAQHAQKLATNGGQKCACSPQCLEASFKELSNTDEIWGKGPFATRGAIRLTIKPPRTRYTREIVFYFQDLVVSFGGAAGLFLGASFISFVEIFYFLLERLLGICIRTKKPDLQETKSSSRVGVSYEAARILELNAILEDQRRFDFTKHGHDFKH